MTKEEKILAGLVLGSGAVVAAAIWSEERDEDGSFFDVVADAIAMLTSNEASRLARLQPEVQDQLTGLMMELGAAGLRVFVGQTLRTAAEEKANVDGGKTSAGLKYSWHELGRAVDLYPIDPATGKPDYAGRRVDLFQQMHATAKARGWRGLAFEEDGATKKYLTNSKGRKVWDGGHLEWRSPHATIAAAVAAEGPSYGIA
jgi:hypothetical protein